MTIGIIWVDPNISKSISHLSSTKKTTTLAEITLGLPWSSREGPLVLEVLLFFPEELMSSFVPDGDIKS